MCNVYGQCPNCCTLYIYIMLSDNENNGEQTTCSVSTSQYSVMIRAHQNIIIVSNTDSMPPIYFWALQSSNILKCMSHVPAESSWWTHYNWVCFSITVPPPILQILRGISRHTHYINTLNNNLRWDAVNWIKK